jgi:hypothetical protein
MPIGCSVVKKAESPHMCIYEQAILRTILQISGEDGDTSISHEQLDYASA